MVTTTHVSICTTHHRLTLQPLCTVCSRDLPLVMTQSPQSDRRTPLAQKGENCTLKWTRSIAGGGGSAKHSPHQCTGSLVVQRRPVARTVEEQELNELQSNNSPRFGETLCTVAWRQEYFSQTSRHHDLCGHQRNEYKTK